MQIDKISVLRMSANVHFIFSYKEVLPIPVSQAKHVTNQFYPVPTNEVHIMNQTYHNVNIVRIRRLNKRHDSMGNVSKINKYINIALIERCES